jgi:hypothetical protein
MWDIFVDEYVKRDCWYVMDAETGEFIWWPSADRLIAVEQPVGFIDFNYNMAMSPDGKWLVTTLRDARFGSMFSFFVFSVEDGQAKEISVPNLFMLPMQYLTWASIVPR